MKELVTNISELLGIESPETTQRPGKSQGETGVLKDAFLEIEDGRITKMGTMDQLSAVDVANVSEIHDAAGRVVFPAFVDSHTHLVFASTREGEFEDRIKGLTYQEIAAKGGGILNSARKLADMDEEDLFDQAWERLQNVMKTGTGAIEIKSGYGLSPEAELKILRIIKRVAKFSPIPVVATFLGAHAFPAEFKENHRGYIDQIINEMLPVIAKENLAQYIDVFCEDGYFSVEEMKEILEAGIAQGLKPKVHVNQFNSLGGIAECVRQNAVSVDHLEVMNPEDIQALVGSNTMPTVLPSCSFFLGIPYAPVRQLLDAGLPVALATDYNPGSTPSGNMEFVLSLACIQYKMTPTEALTGATLHGAKAIGMESEIGSIAVGKRANFIISHPVNSFAQIPYSFGESNIDCLFIDGKIINPHNES